jgi:hypothetical protein
MDTRPVRSLTNISRRADMPIGQCEFCGQDILAPDDVLVWSEEHSYHEQCYRSFLEQRISGEILV